MRLMRSWEPVIQKFRSKLSSWRGRFLSFAGSADIDQISVISLAYASPVWKGILKSRFYVKEPNATLLSGMSIKVGNGHKDASLWEVRAMVPNFPGNPEMWSRAFYSWEADTCSNILHELQAVPFTDKLDAWGWCCHVSGEYTVKAGYSFFSKAPSSSCPSLPLVWFSASPPKIETFLWLLMHRGVATRGRGCLVVVGFGGLVVDLHVTGFIGAHALLAERKEIAPALFLGPGAFVVPFALLMLC
ncbi:hypothetical protein Tsubulata_029695 [Turnera subulata]|uniref:Reverse transcriptase zinc-binding domain-containing protein n=1 Tax=Turnera subulata TaxID=218843 RepID=A0A9Q0JHX2_9ROSI|nr:hypothetical protein Tsubulata_029695 [Turnera subulata]